MAAQSFINTKTVINGVTFAPNNFVAVLAHQELPSSFHIVQDFLASSPINYALTQPVKVSFQAVMQVWNTAKFMQDASSGHPSMDFQFNGVTYQVTPAVIETALHLPIFEGKDTEEISDSDLLQFDVSLGYNGDPKKFGSLFRTKLKREWNFFFDTISRCFLNKVSNFDALPTASVKIGYSLFHDSAFNYGSFILKALTDRKMDKLGFVCFIRFLQLIFNHFCPNAVFENDLIFPIFRISENNIKSLVNSDRANGFPGHAVFPNEVRLLLAKSLPTQYGTSSSAMEQDQAPPVPDTSTIISKQLPKQSTTSTVSQQALVVK